jgi:repressor of nif and glnA expression
VPEAETKTAPVKEPVIAPTTAPHKTIDEAITAVLSQHDRLSVKALAEQIAATGGDINNRAISFALQAMKKRGLVKNVNGVWSLAKRRAKRAG